MTVETPAKLNLGLRVGQRRSDGFHNIHTVFQTIGLYDRLTVGLSANQDDRLTVTGRTAGVPTDGSNLLFRVLERLRSLGLDVPGCEMELKKRIPNEAGLGGASSDAAALLRILQARLDEKDDSRFERVARDVGADVMFFLVGGTVEAVGRGDEFRRLSDLEGWALIVVPPYGVRTEWAYRELDSRDLAGEALKERDETINAEHWDDLKLRNDFTPLISEEEPLQDRLLSRLEDVTDYCSLSGSGSTLYGLFETEQDGRSAQKTLISEFSDIECKLVKFIPRSELPKLEREVPCQSK